MKRSRLSAASAAGALTAIAVLGGAMPSSAATAYVLASDLGTEGTSYPDGWFIGNPQPEVAPSSTDAGLLLTGKVQLLDGGVISDPDLSDLVDDAVVTATGTWTFQIPVFLDPENAEDKQFTTFRPAQPGSVDTETQWVSSRSVAGLTANAPVDFAAIEAAFDAAEAPDVLASGVFVNAGDSATLQSVTWNGDTSVFTPEPVAPITFNDIANNTFKSEIEWLVDAGITTGYANGDGSFSFRGSDAVLREQVAAFLYRYVNDGNPPSDAPNATFSDAVTNTFSKHIAWLAEQKITTGYADGTFRPSAPVLREQIAAFLYRLADEPEFTAPATSPFADVPTSHTFYKEITWLADQGITTGYTVNGVTTFRGSQPVLREQIAAFLFRFDGLETPAS